MGEVKIKKRFDFLDLLLVAIGSTVGAGVFVLLPFGINMAGIGVIFSLLIGSFITIIVALNYGELAASLPMEGGGYSWVTRAFGKESSSFIVGWLVWLANMGYAALSALGFSIYIGVLMNIANPIPIALLALLFLIIINIVTMRTSIVIENVLTIGLMFVFVIFWVHLSTNFNTDYIQLSFQHIRILPIFSAASLLYVLFVGFESVSTVSGEARKKTDLPKAFIFCVLITTILYVVTSFLVIGNILPFFTNGEETLLLDISGPLSPLIVLGASFATLTSMNAAVMAASRNAYALSRDGMIPKIIGKVSRDFKTPIFGLILSGLISGLLVMSNTVEFIASLVDFSYLICISMVCASVILLRIKEPGIRRIFRVPLYPITPIIGMAFPISLIFFLEERAINTGMFWILIGFFVYNFYKIIKIEIKKKKYTFKDIFNIFKKY